MKSEILHQMHKLGKIERTRARDMPEYKKGGWELNEKKAFKSVAPTYLIKLDPIPLVNTRKDLQKYID